MKHMFLLLFLVGLQSYGYADTIITGQEAKPVNEYHDKMRNLAAGCSAYLIYTKDNIDPEVLKRIDDLLNEYQITRRDYKAEVVERINWLIKSAMGQNGYFDKRRALSHLEEYCVSIDYYSKIK